MEVWETLILALVCVVLFAMLYAISGAWKTHPGAKGFIRWVLAQIRSGGPRSGMAAPSRMATDRPWRADRGASSHPNADESSRVAAAIQVLEEMYQEWDQRSRELEARIRALETALARLSTIPAEAERDVERAPVALGHEPGSELTPGEVTRETLYFSILDLLHEGRTHDEIRALLGVSADEIAAVEKLMRTAGRAESGLH